MKKKISVGNVKHSGDEKDISLVKPNISHGMYLDMDSVFGDSRDNEISLGVGNNSFFGSTTNTPKAKKVTTNLVCGFFLGSINYGIDKNNVLLPLSFKIFLEKKWVDPKIVKSQVEVSVRKSFAFDINLNAMKEKSATAKTQFIRKIFSLVNKKSIEMAASLAREKGININSDLKRQGMRIHYAVVGFESDDNLESVFCMKSILGGIKLSWARIDLVQYEKYRNKSWAQMVSFAGSLNGFHFASGSGFPFFDTLGLNNSLSLVLVDNSFLDACLASLEQSLELLTNQVSGIVCKLSNMKLVLQALAPFPKVSATLIAAKEDLVLDMVMDDSKLVLLPLSSASLSVSTLGLSSSKVLTTKIGSLESKLVTLEAFGINVPAKQEDIICWHKNMSNLILIFIKTKLKDKVCLWIAGKFEGVCVFTSGLNSGYLGVGVVVVMNFSLAKHVCKIEEINFLIAKAANGFSFIILGGNFNEDSLKRSTRFKKCVSLGLVNSLVGSLVMKSSTWRNSRSVEKTIDFVLVLSNLVSVIVNHDVINISDYFDTDHRAVSVSVNLNSLLDTQLNFLHRQANKDHWKFDFKGADDAKWSKFKEAMIANAAMFFDGFISSTQFLDLNGIWNTIHKIMMLSANKIFRKKWFKDYNSVFTKESSKFHKLELLVSKIAKASHEKNVDRKHNVVEDFSDDWSHQYQPLEYVFDDAFSNVMYSVNFDELLRVVSNLLDGKAAGLSGMSNELWKHCDKLVLDMLLVLLNSFLKGTTMQSPIFAVGSVVKNVLEKNYEL
ncbi:hypothetical protein G9A89_008830 [Geosiphon pyriformis]|nr:hypothetical protein G9A89_008830 [Geosiphon pyriformis]